MPIGDRLKVLESRVLSDDWAVLKKTRIAWRRNDGSWDEQWRETYDRGNGATILPYDPDRRMVLLVRQFRYPAYVNGHDELLIETAAGLLDAASPEERIRAETEEELGLVLSEVRQVLQVYMSPGSVTEKLHFFIARYSASDALGPGGGLAAEGEEIDRIEIGIDTALSWIDDGRIRDAKTIILLQYAALNLFSPAAPRSEP